MEQRFRGVGEENVEGKEIIQFLLLNLLIGVRSANLREIFLPPGENLVQVEISEIINIR